LYPTVLYIIISHHCRFFKALVNFSYALQSSGPQAYADGYSAVSPVLSRYCFVPIFRGFEQICRVIPLQKNVPYCRKSVGKILQTLTVDTSFFTGCDTGFGFIDSEENNVNSKSIKNKAPH